MGNYILKKHLLDLSSLLKGKVQIEVAPLAIVGPNNLKTSVWLQDFRNFN